MQSDTLEQDSDLQTPGAGEPVAEDHGPLSRFWWLSVARGILALALALSLLFIGVDSAKRLAIFIGFYWATTGLTSIAWGRRGARAPGLWLLAGVIGLVGGTLIVLYDILPIPFRRSYLEIFAFVIILTGLLYLAGGYRIRREYSRSWAWGGTILGVLQIGVGVLLLASPDEVPEGIILFGVLWGLVGGVILIWDGLRLRKAYRQIESSTSDD